MAIWNWSGAIGGIGRLARGPAGVLAVPFRVPLRGGVGALRLVVVVRYDLRRGIPGRFASTRIGPFRVGVSVKRRRARASGSGGRLSRLFGAAGGDGASALGVSGVLPPAAGPGVGGP